MSIQFGFNCVYSKEFKGRHLTSILNYVTFKPIKYATIKLHKNLHFKHEKENTIVYKSENIFKSQDYDVQIINKSVSKSEKNTT